MAAESLFSVGKTVLEKLGPLLQQEAVLLWNLPTELEKLNGTVTAIQALLLDAEEQQKHSHQVRDWLEKLAVLLFDAEDLLDDVATEALRREVAARNQDGADDCNCRIHCRTAVCFLLSIPCRLIYGLKMAHKVKSLREQLDAIYADNNIFHLNPRTEERGKMRKHTNTISSIPDIVVGREDDKKHIKTLLLANDSDVVSVVSIIGIGGMGKTTLAQLIYNDGEIKEGFEMRLWVCVSEAFEVDVIAQKILESATKKKQQELELNTLIDLLKGELSGKKYLLVLDDVWNFDPEKWDKLRSELKMGGRGSKILVTTRFENYAERMMSRGSPYTLSGLSSPQSMSLLGQIVFGEQPDDEKLENITNNAKEIEVEIMKKSVGVPLAVKTIANILYFKDPQTEWLPFLRSGELLGAEQEGSILHNLKLSYDYLPSHLKHCFLHCSLYPKDHTIDVEELICRWVALGFIKAAPNDSQQNLYDLGLQCFMDLAWRSFFQEIQRGFDEKVWSCKMHDLFHELAISIVGSSYKQITPNPTTNTVSEKTFHVSLTHDLWSPPVLISQLEKAKRLQTFYPVSPKWYQTGTNWDANSFKSFVSKFPSLRLLCFPNSEMEMLPHHIQELKHLRYLDLSYNLKMTRLPDSITTLQNLQFLILYYCQTLQELPRDINNLVNLWYLDCRYCIALSHMPKGIGKMSHLVNLVCFVVGKDDGSVSKHVGGLDELNMLNNLRDHLRIVNLRNIGCSNLKDSSSLVAFKIGESANLKGKFHLQWLSLQWDDGNEIIHTSVCEEYLKEGLEKYVEWDECLLNGLQPNLNLTSLEIRACRGGRSPIWISSLTNLVTLSLEMCNMSHHLHDLQGLPVLRKLVLYGLIELEYIDDDDDDGTLNKPFFPSLEYLSLTWCPKLKGWRKRQSPYQFPKLSKLTILDCPLITSMPFFPTLDNKLKLKNTSLQPLLHAMSHCPPTMLQKLVIKDIDHFPKEWLKGMQHLTSLQEIKIEKCSGLDDTLDWHNISHVPKITIDGYYINLNNFPRILQQISEWNALAELLEDIFSH